MDSSSQQHFASSSLTKACADACGSQLPAAFWKPYQSHNMRGVLRIPAPSSILQGLSKPQHARSPADSSSQQHLTSSNKATACADACGFQLPAAFCNLQLNRNMRGVLRIPAPSKISQTLLKRQHARSPTDSSSQQHFALVMPSKRMCYAAPPSPPYNGPGERMRGFLRWLGYAVL